MNTQDSTTASFSNILSVLNTQFLMLKIIGVVPFPVTELLLA